MLFDGRMALAGVAVVDHARSARRESKGSGPGLVPLCTRPRSWGEGGVRGLPPTLLEGGGGRRSWVKGVCVRVHLVQKDVQKQ